MEDLKRTCRILVRWLSAASKKDVLERGAGWRFSVRRLCSEGMRWKILERTCRILVSWISAASQKDFLERDGEVIF